MSAREILTFVVADRRYALSATDVQEVLRAVTITPLPGAPDAVEGVIDLRGEVVPAFDLRHRLALPPKPVEVSDHLVVVLLGGRRAVLRVDRVETLVALDAGAVQDARELMSEAEYLAGVARLPEGLVLIHDLARFLSPTEQTTLAAALGQYGDGAGS